jgi:NAD-dependent DNA ligase
MGAKSAKKLIASIEKSKTAGLDRLIYALGIRNVGEKAAKVLASSFGDIDALAKASKEELVAIPDFGEITADAVIVYFSHAQTSELIENLKALRAAGFRVILDDYGTGVTSVNDLLNFPLDIVKIDRSVLLSAKSEESKAAFRALVELFVDLGADVVCEGIETKEQDEFARSAGCHYGQGFLYFKPTRQNRVFEVIRQSNIGGQNA